MSDPHDMELQKVEEQAAPPEAAPPAEVELRRPDFVDEAMNAELLADADRLAAAIIENPMDVQINARVYGLGHDAMSANTGSVSLMDTKIGEVMREISVESPVNKSLLAIKAELDAINPAVVAGEKVGGFLGFFTSLPKAEKVLEIINERKDSVTDTVDGLKKHLWSERDKALRNAIELGQVADSLADTQDDLQKAAYAGQLIWKRLARARDEAQEPVKKQALNNLVNDLSILVVDIQTVDTLNVQSRLGAEALINNCRKIEQGVARVTNILLPAVATNLGVKAAAAQQAQLTATMSQINQAAGQAIADTAKQIGETTVAMEKMQASAMIDVSKLEEACNEYEKMTAELDKVRGEAELKAREVSKKLGELGDKMRLHADPLTRARQASEEL